MGFMEKYADECYALLRIVSGFLFLWHGASKVLGFPGDGPSESAMMLYVAGPIELIGGIFICIGFMTRISAFVSSGLMAAAYWMAHFSMDNIFPLLNHGDGAILYCFIFLLIAARGAGMWAIDSDAAT